MKKILKLFLIEIVSLYIVDSLVQGLVFEKGVETIILTAAALAASFYIVKPILNVLLLPLNLLTFGLFRWLSSAVAIYLVTLVVPGFSVNSFVYSGYINPWFNIPSINLHEVLALVAFSFLLSIATSIFYWIFK